MKKWMACLLTLTLLLSCIACKTDPTLPGSSGSAISGLTDSDTESSDSTDDKSGESSDGLSLDTSTEVSSGSDSSGSSGISVPIASSQGEVVKPSNVISDLTQSQSSEVVLPKANQNGKVVKLLSWQDPNSEEMLEYAAEFKEYCGATIQFLPTNWGEIGETATKLVMAGSGPDVTYLRNVDNPVMMYKGVLKELNGLIDFNSPLWKGMEFYNSYLRIGTNRYMAAISPSVQEVLWYNTTIFENSEFDSPQVLYDKGELDYAKLLEMAKALTIVKDGTTTQFGLAAHQAGTFGNAIMAAHDRDFVKRADSIYVNNLSDSKVAECMTYLYDVYNTHKVMSNDAAALSNFVKGKVAMFVAPTWITLTDPIKSLHKKKAITFTLMPKANGATSTINWVDFHMLGIGKNAKNPEGGAALINFTRFAAVDNAEVAEQRARNKTKYGYTDRELDYMVSGLKYSRALEYLGFGDMGVLMWGAMYYMATDGTTWNTSRETYIPEADKYIDSINAYLEK
jgi:ABC-type glycerol-3-phosphate transport system substrate-binding protein